jgi:hypothetical protein
MFADETVPVASSKGLELWIATLRFPWIWLPIWLKYSLIVGGAISRLDVLAFHSVWRE